MLDCVLSEEAARHDRSVQTPFLSWLRRAAGAVRRMECRRAPRRAIGGRREHPRSGHRDRLQMAQHRPGPRRPIDRRLRREGTPARGLLRRDRRRTVEDDRRRREVGARHRRPDQELLGRRRRRLGIEARPRFHRDGRVVHPRQHHAGRRRLQVGRRRQDVDPFRLLQLRRDLEDPHPSDQPRRRLRRRLRPLRRAERRARPLQEHRRREDMAAEALPRRQDGRRGRRDRSQESQRDVRGDVGGVSRRVSDVERRPRQRPVQVDRRRRHLA